MSQTSLQPQWDRALKLMLLALCFCNSVQATEVNSSKSDLPKAAAQASPAPAAASSNTEQQKSCAQFVKNYYDWYFKASKRGTPTGISPLEQSLRDKPNFFSAELRKALLEDLKAAAANPGEIVGLDFDPILNAQDIASRYDIGKVTTTKDGQYKVEVFGTWNGKKEKKPDVIPELTLANGQWTFVNFLFEREEPKGDLLKTLKSLRDGRKTFAAQEKSNKKK